MAPENFLAIFEDPIKAKKTVRFDKISTKKRKKKKKDGPKLAKGRSNVCWPVSTRVRLFLPFFEADKHVVTDNWHDWPILGRGKFATVYRRPAALKSESKHLVRRAESSRQLDAMPTAIKAVRKFSVLGDASTTSQAIEEARIHSVLSGTKNVLPFVGAWQDERHLYMATPACDRGSLAQLCQKQGKTGFPPSAVLLAAHQLSKVLQAMHNLGVIYRDMKPKNVMVTRDGHLAVTDFGLSKWLGRRQRTATICGTISFMAPEMLSRQPYGHSVDFWSLGILIYRLVHMRDPFDEKTDDIDEMARIAVSPQWRKTTSNTPVDNAIDALLNVANPDERLANMKRCLPPEVELSCGKPFLDML